MEKINTDINPPVILYHHRTQGVDAQGIHVFEMCRAFESLGYRVIKVALYAEEKVGTVSRTGILSRIISLLPRFVYELLEIGYNMFGVVRLLQAVRAHKPAFIYERYSLFNLCGVIVSRLTATPVVVEFNSPLAWERSRYGGVTFVRLAQWMETRIARLATRTITVTAVLRDILVRHGASSDNIVVMANGINPEEFESIPDRPKPDDAPVLLGFVGWFREWHGLQELIATLDNYGLFQAGAQLVLLGDGPARPGLEALINERHLSEVVSIQNPLDRSSLFERLAEVDIALQPAATNYASPMKLIEYLAAGIAVVAPDQENIREVIREGENGLLFPPGDWEALAKRVKELMYNPKLRLRLGTEGRQTIHDQGLTWLDNATRVVQTLQSVRS